MPKNGAFYSKLFEDKAFTEADIRRYKADLKWFSDLRKTVRMDAQETVDYSQYEGQIRDLIDRYVTGVDVVPGDEPILIDSVDNNPDNWSDEKTKTKPTRLRPGRRRPSRRSLATTHTPSRCFRRC